MKSILITDKDLDGVSCSVLLSAFNVEHDLIITDCYDFHNRVDINYLLENGYTDVFVTDITYLNEDCGIYKSLEDKFNLHYVDHHKSSYDIRNVENCLVRDGEDNSGCSLFYEYLVNKGFELNSDYDVEEVKNYCDIVTSQDNNVWLFENYRMPWFLNIIFKELGNEGFIEEVLECGMNVGLVIKRNRYLLDKEISSMSSFLDKRFSTAVKFDYKDYKCSFMRIEYLLKEAGHYYLSENRDVQILFMLCGDVIMIYTHKDEIDLLELFGSVSSAGGSKNKVLISLSNEDYLHLVLGIMNK